MILSPWQPKILPQEQFVKRTEDVEAGNLGNSHFFRAHMNSDVTHPTPILTETFLQLPNYKGVLSLSATYMLAPKTMREKESAVFNNELIQ